MLARGEDTPLKLDTQTLGIEGSSCDWRKQPNRYERGLSPARQRSIQMVRMSQEVREEEAAGEVFEKHREMLQDLFKSYCAFGEPLNTDHLGSSRFMKLLRDAKIVRPIQKRPGLSSPEHTRYEPYSLKQGSRASTPLKKTPASRRDTNDSLLEMMAPFIISST